MRAPLKTFLFCVVLGTIAGFLFLPGAIVIEAITGSTTFAEVAHKIGRSPVEMGQGLAVFSVFGLILGSFAGGIAGTGQAAIRWLRPRRA